MSRARLSGPPAITPLLLPASYHNQKMTAVRGNDVQNAGQEAVSPLSPRSEAILLRNQNSVRRISPLNSPVAVLSNNRGRRLAPKRLQPSPMMVQTLPRDSYPPAHIRNVPPRKPVNERRPAREGLVVAQVPIVVGSHPHHSVRPEYVHSSRPRSQSVQAVPDTFLQDFTPPAPAVPDTFLQDYTPPAPAAPAASISSRPSRSQSVPPNPTRQQQQEYERRTCAHCGKAQKNHPANFLCCKTCRGVYYCSISCWEQRVCHRSIKCTVCDCTQASSSPDFTRCQKCSQVGRELWYCSDECWDQRNCHVRSDPPQPPPKTRQDFRSPRPLPDRSRDNDDQRDRQFQQVRDLEAQRKKEDRTPRSERTRCTATAWAVTLVFVLLCIFVPIVAVSAARGHVN